MQHDIGFDMGGPHFEVGMVDARGRLTRFCKGDNGAAIQEQQAARLQSAKQFQIQMTLMQKQIDAANNVKPAVVLPTAAPQTVDQNTLDQRREVARQQGRRFSFASTMAQSSAPGQTQALGGASMLGGATAP